MYPNLTRGGGGGGAGVTPLQRVYSHLEEEDYAIITFIENKRLKILNFFWKRANKIHFSRAVSCGCIVHPWILLVCLQRKLENCLFSEDAAIR